MRAEYLIKEKDYEIKKRDYEVKFIKMKRDLDMLRAMCGIAVDDQSDNDETESQWNNEITNNSKNILELYIFWIGIGTDYEFEGYNDKWHTHPNNIITQHNR